MKGPRSEAVYTPDSELRRPIRLLRHMARDISRSRELAWRLMVRDLNAQYRQSLFGVIWAFAPAIAMAIGFTVAVNAKIINVGATDLPYAAYVMFSMVLWQTFVEALNGPVQAVANAKSMLSRINFPREALILAKVGEVCFNCAIKLILVIALFVWFQISPTWKAFFAPLALLQLIALGTIFGMLLAPLALLYHDVAKGLILLTGLWLFLTPIVYPIPTDGVFAAVVQLNPVTPLLVTTRELATTGAVSDPASYWLVSTIVLIGFAPAWVIYRLAMPLAIERVSS